MTLKRAYRILLRLYPMDYRIAFGAEMLNAFEKVAGQRRFAVAELIGLIVGAGKEWIAKWTTDKAVRGRCLPDVRMMRPVGVTREVWFASGPEQE